MVKLRKIVQSAAVQDLLRQMARDQNEPFWLFDQQGVLLWGENFPGPSGFSTLPIQVNGQRIGEVVGGQNAHPLAAMLNLVAKYEHDQREVLNETLERYKEITLLYNLGEKLIAHLDIQTVSDLIVGEALDNLRGDNASLMLFNEKTGLLEVVAARSKTAQPLVHHRLAPGEGIAGHVFMTGQAEIVNNVKQDPRYVQGYASIEAILCAPLKFKEKTIGVVNLSSAEPCQFSAAELKLFNAITYQGAYALENAQLHQQKVQEDRIKNNLQRYVSPQLVDAIIKSEDEDAFEPQSKNITTLFSDIRNFTLKCEALPPERMVYYLNRYFSEMVEIIFHHNGAINKFVGDMIVALFGAPYDLENDAAQAVQAAIDMQKRLDSFDDPWIRENFLTGIGISKGDVVVGNIGSHHHMDYTAIGDAVNVAARLQAMARGRQILVTDTIYEETKHAFHYRKFDQEIQLRGRTQPVQIFEVLY